MIERAQAPPAPDATRIVVFTSPGPRASAVENVEALAHAMPDVRFLVIIGGRKLKPGSYVRSKIRRLQREPVSYPLELLGQCASALAAKFSRAPRPATGEVKPPEWDTLGLSNVEIRRFDRMRSDACRDAVSEFAPWLGISIAAPILPESLFELPERGTINLHKSLLPEYRGMPPGFWELHDGATQAGATVHRIEAGLDTGPIVHQRAIDIPKFTTIGGLAAQLDELGETVLLEAVEKIRSGTAEERPQAEPATPTRSRPAHLVRRRVERRLAARHDPSNGIAGIVRNIVKTLVLAAWVHVLTKPRDLLQRLRGTCPATVLLYHRVSDDFRDSVTVGIEQFRDQMHMLARKYDVVDLATLLAERGKPRHRPVVAITFDDGYADNALAARILRREGLPCTFFVCTGIVGSSDRAFPQDTQKLGFRVPSLSWNQVETMARHGFTIGNHTEGHTDVAAVPLDHALEQIRTATTTLEERLGPRGPERWFAFPYGRPKNIDEDVRRALPDNGIDVCLSAYGGQNAPDFDEWNILRQGVDANFSILALRAVLAGWSLR